jgi:hypothetical protein
MDKQVMGRPNPVTCPAVINPEPRVAGWLLLVREEETEVAEPSSRGPRRWEETAKGRSSFSPRLSQLVIVSTRSRRAIDVFPSLTPTRLIPPMGIPFQFTSFSLGSPWRLLATAAEGSAPAPPHSRQGPLRFAAFRSRLRAFSMLMSKQFVFSGIKSVLGW